MANGWRAVSKRLSRLLRYYLIIPLHRSRHSPEYTARGVLIGLMIAFTPTVGIQIPLVAVLWAGFRALHPNWDFSLIVAMAWTWVTNVFTVPPVYYCFFVTGRVLLGHHDRIPGYRAFASQIASSLEHGDGLIAATVHSGINLMTAFGLPLFIGSLPWALVIGIFGYIWSLKFVRHHRKVREERRHRRHQREKHLA